MEQKKIRVALSTLPLVALLSAPAALAAGVDAGTLIENTATATYEASGTTQTVDSNTVSLRVDELLDVTLTSLDSGPVASGPGSAVLTYEITNTGNGPEAFTLTANPSVAGNDFDVTVDGIAVDTNGNGIYDPGVDAILTGPATTDPLAADANLTVFVLVTMPAGATDTQQSDLDLLVEAVTGTGTPGTTFAGQGEGGTDAVVGTSGADDNQIGSIIVSVTTVDLVKSAIVSDPFGGSSQVPGAIITYTIRADVTGSGSVANLVVNDAFPTGTTYQASTLTLDSAALTDAAGDDAGEANATGISVDLGTVAGGTSHSVSFEVVID